jgi:hypothetical protein
MKQFNLNCEVGVKLTAAGEIYLERYNLRNHTHITGELRPDEYPEYRFFQGWQLMNIFGEAMYLGGPNPINLNIILNEKHLVEIDG